MANKVYPSVRYHATEDPVLVPNQFEDEALGSAWSEVPLVEIVVPIDIRDVLSSIEIPSINRRADLFLEILNNTEKIMATIQELKDQGAANNAQLVKVFQEISDSYKTSQADIDARIAAEVAKASAAGNTALAASLDEIATLNKEQATKLAELDALNADAAAVDPNAPVA